MKTFEIITEADARVLTRGETVMLAPRRPRHAAGAGHAARSGASSVVREGRVVGRRRVAGAGGRHPHASRLPATTPASRCGATLVAYLRGRGPRGATISAPTAPTRSTIPTSRRRWRGTVARGEADARHRHRRRGHRLGDRRQQDRRRPGGDGDDRDDRALLARAQRRQRADARRHAGRRRTRRGRSSTTWLTTPMREPRYIRRLAKIRDLEQSWIGQRNDDR